VKTLSFGASTAALAVVVLALGLGRSASAQSIPAAALTFGGGRITLGGDISASFSCTDSATAVSDVCADDTGFFNYTDYEHSTLRMLRVDVTAAVRATDQLSVLAELRSEDVERFQPYALFVRYRPWKSRPFDV
jgi:hypothetical protein